MGRILHALPVATRPDEVSVHDQRIRIRAYQIVFWGSLTVPKMSGLGPDAARIPIILDTGYTHHFSINECQLFEWAGARSGRVWIYRNVPGERIPDPLATPIALTLPEGFAIYPGTSGPRLPLLGLRALVQNKLHLTIAEDRVHLRTRRQWWPFG